MHVEERTRELKETRDYLENLINYANAPIIVWDADSKITLFNHAFERLTGRTMDEMLGQKLDILFPKENLEHAMSHVNGATKGKRLEVEEIPIQHKDGSVRTVLWNSATLYDENGASVATIAQGQDITERKEAEEALWLRTEDLEQANRELEAFSYSVSHDLRAPLRSIDGFSQLIMRRYFDKLDDKGRDYLDELRKSSQLMAQLMDDILTLSRISRYELTKNKVDLSALAIAIARDLKKSQPEHNVEFVIAQGLETLGDERLLRIVLENLMGNAYKFTGKTKKAKIEIGTLEIDGTKAFFVRDNGVGFDIQFADKLFKPFHRLHTPKEFPGTGIGLASVRRIIERHGGKVWAKSEVDKGATFYFTLSE
jgi:PAS domain S-box-containing protein